MTPSKKIERKPVQGAKCTGGPKAANATYSGFIGYRFDRVSAAAATAVRSTLLKAGVNTKPLRNIEEAIKDLICESALTFTKARFATLRKEYSRLTPKQRKALAQWEFMRDMMRSCGPELEDEQLCLNDRRRMRGAR